MSLIEYNGESKVIKKICELLNTMSGVSFVVVQELPTSDIQTNIIYLVPKQDAGTDNIYDEYINTDGTSQGWELIGTTEIDLSDYYTKTETDDLLDDKADTSDIKDGTLTIQLNGTTEQTFTANSSSNKTANIKAVDWVSNSMLGAKNLYATPFLHPYYDEAYVIRDVTYTQENGIISVSGTCNNTGNSYCQILKYANPSTYHPDAKPLSLKAGTYKLTGGVSENVWINLSYFDKTDTSTDPSKTMIGEDTGDGLEFTVTEQMANNCYFSSFAFVKKNYVTQGEKIKPMIRLLSDSDNTWQPYSMTNQELTNNKASKEEAEKVKQTNVTNAVAYRVLLSKSGTDNEETDTVNKSSAFRLNASNGYLYLDRPHTSTSVQEEALVVGNSTADGTAGANSGILRLYGKGAYFAQFRDMYNYLTANRNYLFRDATGMLGLYSDVTDFAVMSNLNILDNLLYPPYYHSSGNYPNSTNPTMTYSTNFETGEYTVKGYDTVNRALNLKRYTSGFYLPAGKYRISGCPSGGSSSKYSLRVYKSTEGGSTTGIGSDYGSGLEFSLTERTLMQIVFYVNANQSVDFTFRPKLERLSEWVDLGVQTIGSTITLTEQYSELMVEVNYGDVFYQNIHILRTQLTSIPKYYYATISEDYDFYASVYLDGTDIKLKGNTQVSGTDYNLYAKA